jgi:hypothetical protein
MAHSKLFSIITALFVSTFVYEQTYAVDFIQKEVPDSKLLGSGHHYHFIWHLYDAELYTTSDTLSFEEPFALRLIYQRKLYGKRIADQAVEELTDLGFDDTEKLADWHKQMLALFPDVEDGTSITGIYNPGKPTAFYKNHEKLGTVEDPAFGKWFFAIWLDEKTSASKLRKNLINETEEFNDFLYK